jgi:hypothetical protein
VWSLNIVPSFRYRERQTAELWERNTIRCGAVDINPGVAAGMTAPKAAHSGTRQPRISALEHGSIISKRDAALPRWNLMLTTVERKHYTTTTRECLTRESVRE